MSQDIRKAFGKTIQQMRLRQGYSQEAFADATCLDRTYVRSIERGEQNVSLDNNQKSAKVLKIKPAISFKDLN